MYCVVCCASKFLRMLLLLYLILIAIGIWGGGGGGGGQLPPPPSLVRNINYLGNFYLRVVQSSCSCFVSLIFSIFSFHLSLAPCMKTHTKMQEMALKRLYFSKFFWGACPRTPLKVLTPSARSGKFVSAPPPPQFLSPYAYANCSLYFKNTSSHTEKKE